MLRTMPKKKLMVLLCIPVLLSALILLPPLFLTQEEASEPATRSAELGLILLDQDDGLFILAVIADSAAEQAGFRAGDLLLRSGETPLTTTTMLESLITQDHEELSILLERNGKQLSLELPTTKGLAKQRRNQYTNLMNGGGQP